MDRQKVHAVWKFAKFRNVCDHLLQQRQLRISDEYDHLIVGYSLLRCCSTRAQVRRAVSVVFPVDFDGGEHVYRVHPINVQLVTDPVIMPNKEEPGCHYEASNNDVRESKLVSWSYGVA